MTHYGHVGKEEGARASRPQCLASRQTHHRPGFIAQGDHLPVNGSKTCCGKDRGSAARDAAPRPGRSHSLILPRCPQSKPVKPGQSSLVGQAGASNLCKYFKMNSLQNKQPRSGQTMCNLVKHGQNEPIRFGPAARCPARKFGLAVGAAMVTVLLRGQTAFAVVFGFQPVN